MIFEKRSKIGWIQIFFWIWNSVPSFPSTMQRNFEICFVFSHFFVRASNCSHYSNFENWCLKMKSTGLYHTYILWKYGLLLDFQQVKLYYLILKQLALTSTQSTLKLARFSWLKAESANYTWPITLNNHNLRCGLVQLGQQKVQGCWKSGSSIKCKW